MALSGWPACWKTGREWISYGSSARFSMICAVLSAAPSKPTTSPSWHCAAVLRRARRRRLPDRDHHAAVFGLGDLIGGRHEEVELAAAGDRDSSWGDPVAHQMIADRRRAGER